MRGDTIHIPCVFVAWTGHALDEKTPLLRAEQVLDALDVLPILSLLAHAALPCIPCTAVPLGVLCRCCAGVGRLSRVARTCGKTPVSLLLQANCLLLHLGTPPSAQAHVRDVHRSAMGGC